MTNQEIQRLLEKKKNELSALEQELNRTKYSRHVSALIDPINNSSEVIKVINDNHLNPDDCRYVGEQIATRFSGLYKNFAPKIAERQERRNRKNQARKERRAKQNKATIQTAPSSATAGNTSTEKRES